MISYHDKSPPPMDSPARAPAVFAVGHAVRGSVRSDWHCAEVIVDGQTSLAPTSCDLSPVGDR